ncbi:HNH endonuclease family protein, partial [Escherichia coli]|nr:HNH endonuclease family protein [Escherichia coli]
IKTTWKSITNNLESCGESDNPLRFLRYFLMARYHHGILREDDIYKWIISAEGELSLQYKTHPMVLVKELEKLSERYANLVNATNEAAYWRENARFPNVSNIGYINKYRSRQHLVLLMALDISCSDDVMDFLGAQLESFLFFTNTMAIQSKTYEQRFTQWAVKLRDVKTKAEVANVVSVTLIPFVVERLDEFKERFSIINDYNFTPQYRQRYVLGRLENHIRHLCGFPEKSQQAIQQMQIEHILPQTVRNAPENGEFSDANRTSYVYKIGNVTLLEGTINQSVNNCNDLSEDWFLKKQTEYLNSEIIMTRLLHSQYSIGDNTALNRFKLKYGYEYQDWSAENITSRQRLLMDLAIDCWRFNDQRIDAYIVNNLGTGLGNEFTL